MRAAVQARHGSPGILRLRDVDLPRHGDGEVLIGVRASELNPYDWRRLRARPAFIRLIAGRRGPRQHAAAKVVVSL